MSVFPKHLQVVIIGAGPTGLSVANLLASYGIASLLLEQNRTPMDIPRAVVLDDRGARVLQAFGADKTCVAQAAAGLGSKYYDDHGVCFSQTGAGEPTYGFETKHYISQPELESALIGHVANAPLIDMRFNCQVQSLSQTNAGVTLEVIHGQGRCHRITCDYVLACDGGRSRIRESLGIRIEGSTYSHDWLVIDALNDPDHSLFSKFYCSGRRPHVSFPAPHGGRRYEFMLLPGETQEIVLAKSFINDLLSPYRTLKDGDILRKVIYTFHARVAEKFRAGRVLLLGDAAHLTPPFSGQGMNAGLRDAMNVAWKLVTVLRAGADDRLLDSYDIERRPRVWAMTRLAVALGDIVMPADPSKLLFREHLGKALKPFPQVQDYFMQMRFLPKPRYEKGAFVGLVAEPAPASLIGEMIPQPALAGKDGPVKLDSALGTGFALIAQNERGQAALAGVRQSLLFGHDLAKIRLFWSGAPEQCPITAYGIGEQGIGKPLQAHHDQIMLIRPDRYCAAAFAPDALARGLSDMASVLELPKLR